jgi:oxygen-dependent protoporphyrinogen oxidase
VTEAVVIGAGISGLAAAYELQRRGVPVVALEAGPRAGGLILTEREGPFLIDAGPDAMLAAKRAGVALCDELGISSRLVPTSPPRAAFVLRGGRLRPLPHPSVLGIPTTWRGLAAADLLSWRGRLRMALEPMVPARKWHEASAPRREASASSDADESIASFIGRRFGREVVDYVAEPLVAGIHAGDVDRLSIRALFPALVEAEHTHGSVLGALRTGTRTRTRTENEEPRIENLEPGFLSFPTGLQELVDALVAALPAQAIQTRARVTRIARIASRGTSLQARPASWRVDVDGRAPLEGRALIIATPAWAAADLLAPVDTAIAGGCRAIPYVSSAIVVLAFDRTAVRRPLSGSGFVVPRVERGARLLAATFLSSKWAGRAPEGRVLLRAFLGGVRDPDAVDRTDERLIDETQRELSAIVGLAGPPLFARVYRWPRAAAQHEVGHLARVADIDRRLAQVPGVFLTGSGFRVTGIPDCIADARRVATDAARYLRCAEGAEHAEMN